MSLEGSKQGAHLWQAKLAGAFKRQEFERSLIDPSLFVKRNENGVIIVIVWVDDMAIAYSSTEMLDAFKTELSKDINVKFEDKLDRFVGLEIERDLDAGTIFPSQAKGQTCSDFSHVCQTPLLGHHTWFKACV